MVENSASSALWVKSLRKAGSQIGVSWAWKWLLNMWGISQNPRKKKKTNGNSEPQIFPPKIFFKLSTHLNHRDLHDLGFGWTFPGVGWKTRKVWYFPVVLFDLTIDDSQVYTFTLIHQFPSLELRWCEKRIIIILSNIMRFRRCMFTRLFHVWEGLNQTACHQRMQTHLTNAPTQEAHLRDNVQNSRGIGIRCLCQLPGRVAISTREIPV